MNRYLGFITGINSSLHLFRYIKYLNDLCDVIIFGYGYITNDFKNISC